MFGTKNTIVDPSKALPGRDAKMPIPARHFVLDAPLDGELPGTERAMFALGCFWGAERKFYQQKGVVSTAVGYASGTTPNPSYKEVCSGMTGHAEVVRVIYDPKVVSYNDLLKLFWENHDPTQGMRQGNDEGTQYRSGIYAYTGAQLEQAKASSALYQEKLKAAGFGAITTEVLRAPEFYFAEEYHQQYLAKSPDGYCGIGGTGVACPIGLVQGS